MIRLQKVNAYSAHYNENEIFFLHSLNQYIVINKAYEGILVFDNKLNLINRFILSNAEFLLEEVYTDYQRNRMVFKLEEGLWFVDIINGGNHYIKLSVEDKHIPFPRLYEFDNTGIYMADKDNIIRWIFDFNYILKLDFLPDTAKKTLNALIHAWYQYMGYQKKLNKDCIITYDRRKKLELYSFDNHHIYSLELENRDWYTFQLLNNYVLAVSEERIAIFNIASGSNIPYEMEVNAVEYFYGATLVECDGRILMAVNIRNDFDGAATVALYSVSDETDRGEDG